MPLFEWKDHCETLSQRECENEIENNEIQRESDLQNCIDNKNINEGHNYGEDFVANSDFLKEECELEFPATTLQCPETQKDIQKCIYENTDAD